MSTETLYQLLPEIILLLFATGTFVVGAFLPGREGWSWLAAGGLLLAGIALYQQEHAVRREVRIHKIRADGRRQGVRRNRQTRERADTGAGDGSLAETVTIAKRKDRGRNRSASATTAKPW